MTIHSMEEFTQLAATVPAPTARLTLPQRPATDALGKDWNAERKAFQRDLLAWRSAFLRHLASLRVVLDMMVEEVGAEKTGQLVRATLPRIRETMAEITSRELDRLNLRGGIAAVDPKLTEQYRRAMQQLIDWLTEAQDSFYELELDFDPDAHRGKEFDNINDLLADLHS